MRKTTFLAIAVAIFVGAISVVAQTVVITPRKTIHRRPKPQYPSKRTFTVRRPIAKASTVALSRKITSAISPEKVLELNVREEMSEYQWLEEADYKVLFNRDGVLVVEQWMTGTAAYPDSVTKRVVVDVSTGSVVTVASVFKDLPELAAKAKKQQEAEIVKAKKDIKADDPEADPDDLFSETNFTVEDFKEFSVDANGVTFYYDYGFPHVIEAWQPPGEYRFSWAEIKPFVRTDGLLARFVR